MLIEYFLYDPRKGGEYNVYEMVLISFTLINN